MVSPALVVTYLFLVLVVITIIVLCCLGCGCHVPLGKCVKCFCENTTVCCNRCCRRKKKKHGNILDDVSEENAEADEKRVRRKQNDEDTAIAGCCSWIPYVLTCGMCCGAFTDEAQAAPGRGGSVSVNNNTNVVVAQPVVLDDDIEVVGTEPIVAISMPLLAINN